MTRAARTPAEAGGGEEAIKREAGRAPRQKERSSGPARRGRCTGDAGPGHRAVWRSERARLSLSSPPPQSQSSELPGPPEASVVRPAVATSCTRPPHRSRPTRAPARPSAAPSPPPSRGSAAAAVPEQPVSTVGRRLGAEGGAAAPCEPGCRGTAAGTRGNGVAPGSPAPRLGGRRAARRREHPGWGAAPGHGGGGAGVLGSGRDRCSGMLAGSQEPRAGSGAGGWGGTTGSGYGGGGEGRAARAETCRCRGPRPRGGRRRACSPFPGAELFLPEPG